MKSYLVKRILQYVLNYSANYLPMNSEIALRRLVRLMTCVDCTENMDAQQRFINDECAKRPPKCCLESPLKNHFIPLHTPPLYEDASYITVQHCAHKQARIKLVNLQMLSESFDED